MYEERLTGALDDDDFDLAAELLLARPCLGEGWNAVSSFGFAVLERVEDEVGVLPSLSLDGNEFARLPVAARPHYVAATAYHTAYVMGLLCAAILRARALPDVLPLLEAGLQSRAGLTPLSAQAADLMRRLAGAAALDPGAAETHCGAARLEHERSGCVVTV